MMADGEQIHSAMYPGSILGDRLSEQTEVNIRQHALEAACFVVCATAWLDPDMNSSWLFFAVAFLVGALITAQTGSNARLKEAFGEALPAVIVSSSLGVILLIAVTLSARTPWPSLSSLAGGPWWGWLGGALGAVYAVATVLLARELGAAPLTALVVTGELVCSLRARPFRLGRLHRAPGGPWALAGCVLMGGGFFLIARF